MPTRVRGPSRVAPVQVPVTPALVLGGYRLAMFLVLRWLVLQDHPPGCLWAAASAACVSAAVAAAVHAWARRGRSRSQAPGGGGARHKQD